MVLDMGHWLVLYLTSSYFLVKTCVILWLAKHVPFEIVEDVRGFVVLDRIANAFGADCGNSKWL